MHKADTVKQKLPITTRTLRLIHSLLNLNCSIDSSFWAICLTAFFGRFRKTHLLTKSKTTFDPDKQFTKSDFRFFPWGALVQVRWSKTIQFRERAICIPLPCIPDSPLCPVYAIKHAFSFTCNFPSDSQAFTWLHPSSLQPRAFTYQGFLDKLRTAISDSGLCGIDYASHSFRRGGASFAFHAGVPIDLTKILSDWKSNAVLLYLTVPLTVRI